MRTLFLIPARAGSKGLPGKNTKILGNKPLIVHTIDFVLQNIDKKDDILFISTDDDDVIKIAADLGINVPFKRPEELATDEATTYDVIMHALQYYESKDIFFDTVLLLQPTSPFRLKEDFINLVSAYDNDCDMVVSVKKSKENPYFTLFEENALGFLNKSKIGNFQRRQDCPDVFAYNGSMYLMKTDSLKNSVIANFKKIKKVLMPDERSVDIDTIADWILTEYYFNSINKKDSNL
jgi:CMP-N,N'-diacetyllegionaminic acid synthase